MSELEEVKASIKAAEADLERAKDLGNVELELEIRRNLTLLLKDKERLTSRSIEIGAGSAVAYPAPPASFTPLPPAPIQQQLLLVQMTSVNVNGSMTTLSEHKGFRNYVKAAADHIGVTGTIQRYHHTDVKIEFEGTIVEVEDFSSFLKQCHGQGMIEHFADVREVTRRRLLYASFNILTDFSRTTDKGGKVLRGKDSDQDHDKVSEYSADRPMMRGSQRSDE